MATFFFFWKKKSEIVTCDHANLCGSLMSANLSDGWHWHNNNGKLRKKGTSLEK